MRLEWLKQGIHRVDKELDKDKGLLGNCEPAGQSGGGINKHSGLGRW